MRYTEAAVDASRRRTTASADTSPEDLPARNRPYLWRSSRLQHEAAVLCCVVLLVSRVKLAAVSKHLTPFSCPTTASHHFLFWHTPPASNWPLSSGAYKFFIQLFYQLTCTFQQNSETAIQSDFFAALCRLPTHYVPAVRNCLFTSTFWLKLLAQTLVADKRGLTTADLLISILT